MPTIIIYLLIGICLGAFVTASFVSAHRELSVKQKSIADLRAQMALHERLFSEARDGPNEKVAAGMLKTSQMLCNEAAKGYNSLLQKPINRIPAMLMGFRKIE